MLISPTICHAQGQFVNCDSVSDPQFYYNGFSFTGTQPASNTWVPGQTYAVTAGGWGVSPAGCLYEVIRVYNPAGQIDPYVTTSPVFEAPGQLIPYANYVDATHTSFTLTVASGAPDETDIIQLVCEVCFLSASEYKVQISIQTPLPPPPPPPPCGTITIDSVTPSTWTMGKTYQVTITGTDFVAPSTSDDPTYCQQNVTQLWVEQGENSYPPDFTVVSPTQITATINIDASTSLTAGSATLWAGNCYDGCVTETTVPVQIVNCDVPTISSISPSTWFAGRTYNPVTITGTNFTTTANATAACPVTAVNITAADNSVVPIANVSVDSDKKITLAGVTPPASDPTETATVTVGAAPNTANSANLATQPQILGNQIQCDPSMNCTQPVISTADGTTPPTQNAVVGQQIKLTTPALPGSITATSTTWTVPSSPANIGARVFGPIDAYNNPTSASATATVLTSPSLTTYWLYPKPSVPVTYQYCVNIPGLSADDIANGLNCSLVANAAFNVTGPTATIAPSLSLSSTPPVTGVWWVSPPDSGCNGWQYLSFGTLVLPTTNCELAVDKDGIGFLASPQPDSGRFEWVQMITSNILTGTAPGQEVAPNVGATGLDTYYPYPTIDTNWNTVNDAPTVSLNDPALTTKSRAFSATMYLLWTGNASDVRGRDTNYIDVPIGYISWSVNGTADQNTAATPPWSLDPASGQTPAAFKLSTDDGTATHGLPAWTTVAYPNTTTPGNTQ